VLRTAKLVWLCRVVRERESAIGPRDLSLGWLVHRLEPWLRLSYDARLTLDDDVADVSCGLSDQSDAPCASSLCLLVDDLCADASLAESASCHEQPGIDCVCRGEVQHDLRHLLVCTSPERPVEV
jgi:hypothetical protein